jgi:hypothetical protein
LEEAPFGKNICFIGKDKVRTRRDSEGRKVEDVGVMKDEDLKLEEMETSQH